jgi:hypothetical protein
MARFTQSVRPALFAEAGHKPLVISIVEKTENQQIIFFCCVIPKKMRNFVVSKQTNAHD